MLTPVKELVEEFALAPPEFTFNDRMLQEYEQQAETQQQQLEQQKLTKYSHVKSSIPYKDHYN